MKYVLPIKAPNMNSTNHDVATTVRDRVIRPGISALSPIKYWSATKAKRRTYTQ